MSVLTGSTATELAALATKTPLGNPVTAASWQPEEYNSLLAAVQGIDSLALPLAGGVLTGALVLAGAPSADLHAATKLYVDGLIAGLDATYATDAALTAAIAGLGSTYATDAELASAISGLSSAYQPLDADLTALAALSATAGMVKRTGAGAFSVVTLVAADISDFNAAADARIAAANLATDAELASAISGLSSVYQPLDADLTALAGVTATGFLERTGAGAATARALVAGDIPTITSAKISDFATAADARIGAAALDALADVTITTAAAGHLVVRNAGNTAWVNRALLAADIPDISATYQPADADLTGLAGLSTTGFVKRTGAGTFSAGALAGGDIPDLSGVYQPLDTLLTSLAALSDPGADRVAFWDDSANAIAWLTIGDGLLITDTTIEATGGGGAGALNDLSDVTLTSPAEGDFLVFDTEWVNRPLVAADISDTLSWSQVSKTGSSLADLATRSASDLAAGTLPDGRFPATLPAASGVNLTALNATNLGSGTVPDARFPSTLPALNGSALTALNASNISSGSLALARITALTASRLVVSDGSGLLSASAVTATEAGYLSGVTSAIQTQLGGKLATSAIGSTVQAWDADLDAVAALDATAGYLVKTGAGAFARRTLTGTSNQVAITNGDGTSGNPVFSLPQSIHTAATPQFAAIGLGGAAAAAGLKLYGATSGSLAITVAATAAQPANNASPILLSTAGEISFPTGSPTGSKFLRDDGSWQTPAGGSGSVATDTIWDAAGDLAVGTGADTAGRLAKGTALQVLRVNSGATALEWATPSGGSASGQVLAMLYPESGTPPATLYATFDVRPGGSTPAENFTVLDFDASTVEYMDFRVLMPGVYAGGGINVTVFFSATTATSGDVIWSAALRRMTLDTEDADASQTYSYIDGTATAVSSTNGAVKSVTIALSSGANMDSVAAGDLFILRVRRFASDGSDTLADDAELWGVRITEQ